jgi:N-acetylglucosamine-6-sulfatase
MASVTRRQFLATSATAAAAAYLGGRPTARRRTRPNVLFMLTDDQRWDAMSCVPDRFFPALRTPNMDRLAGEGVRFANAFCTWSLCSPSRASFLSGAYPHVHGVRNNFTEYPSARLPSYHSHLRAAGYRTAYIGKWHMGEGKDTHRPPFDYWASHAGQGHYQDTEFNVSHTINATTFDVQGKREVLKGYYTHVVTDLAVDWLKTVEPPFSLQIGHKAPHGRWYLEPKYEHLFDGVPVVKPNTESLIPSGTPEWVRRRVKTWHGIDGPLYETNDYGTFVRTYHATIPSVDDSLGEIIEVLRGRGELDNTIIVFGGDNGFLLGEHASIDKRTAWEESIRIPLLMRYPEAIRDPKVIDEMVLNIDVAPSVLDLAGVEHVRPAMQGRSTRPLLDGKRDGWRKSWYYQYDFEKEFPYTPNVRAVRTRDWKYIHYPNGAGQPDTELAELYHLAADPKEQRNLIADPAARGKLAELRAELVRLQRTTGALPDRMPVNPKLSFEMPAASIR